MSGVIAVTGATGVIGTPTCIALLEDGWTVRGLCRVTSDRRPLEDRISWVVGDIVENAAALDRLVAGADAVVHLAGIGLASASPARVRRVNVQGTRALLDACRRHDVGRILFASTAGTRRRPDGTPADESDIATPVGAYQQSKAAAEMLVDHYGRTDGDAVTVHPTAVLAPGDRSFSAPLMEMATEWYWPAHLPGGLNIVGCSDVVAGIVSALHRGERGEHYILGGENLAYAEAVRRIAAVVDGRPARLEIPESLVRAAGPPAALLGRLTGRRLFPYDSSMARLATQPLFHVDRKARRDLGYTSGPLEDHVPPVQDWLDGRPPQDLSAGQRVARR